MLLLGDVVVIVEVAPQRGSGSWTEDREEVVGVREHDGVVGRLSGHMGELSGLPLTEEASDGLPCVPAFGGGNFVKREGTVPRTCHSHNSVCLRDIEPLQVLDRGVENRTLKDTFGGGVVEHLADLAVLAAHVVFVVVLGDAGVDLYGIVDSVLVGVRGGVAPGGGELVGVGVVDGI